MELVRQRTGAISASAAFARAALQAYNNPHLASMARRAGRYVGRSLKRKYSGKNKNPYSNAKRAKSSKSRARASAGSSNLITAQRDYNSRRTSKRLTPKEKRWRKFVKNVKKAETWSQPLMCLVESNIGNVTIQSATGNNSSAKQQVCNITPGTGNPILANTRDFRLGVYTSSIDPLTNGVGLNKIFYFMRDQATALAKPDDTLVLKLQGDEEFKDFYVKGCSATFAIKNVLSSTSQYLDILEFISMNSSKDPTKESALITWVNHLAQSGFPLPYADSNQWSQNSVQSCGVTPYHVPDMNKYWKMIKKTRVFFQPGEIVNYHMIGYKGKVDFGKDLRDRYNNRGRVKDIIFIANPTHNPNLGTTSSLFDIQWSKSYHVGISPTDSNTYQPISANIAYSV